MSECARFAGGISVLCDNATTSTVQNESRDLRAARLRRRCCSSSALAFSSAPAVVHWQRLRRAGVRTATAKLAVTADRAALHRRHRCGLGALPLARSQPGIPLFVTPHSHDAAIQQHSCSGRTSLSSSPLALPVLRPHCPSSCNALSSCDPLLSPPAAVHRASAAARTILPVY